MQKKIWIINLVTILAYLTKISTPKCRKTEKILTSITDFIPVPTAPYDFSAKNIPLEGTELLKFYDEESRTNLYLPDYKSKP